MTSDVCHCGASEGDHLFVDPPHMFTPQIDLDWSKPCPAPIRCPLQTYCPPACKAAGNREGNIR